MQDCFRKHPETYGSELDDDDEDLEIDGEAMPDAPEDGIAAAATSALPETGPSSSIAASTRARSGDPVEKTERAKVATQQVNQNHDPQSESPGLVSKASHD